MPPFVSLKRARSSSPARAPPPKKQATQKRAKPTLFDTADAPKDDTSKIAKNRAFLDSLDEDSELSEASSDEFEDVEPAARRRKASPAPKDEDDEEEDDEMDWEDAIQSSAAKPVLAHDLEIADVHVSMKDDVEPEVSAGINKKGPSKRDRQIRIRTHCLHVQSLMWHNALRNKWLNDKEVQANLVHGLSEGVMREVTRWREAMGMLSKEELHAKKQAAAASKSKGRKGKKAKDTRGSRDWALDAEHAEQGVPNLSGGDPLLRLLKVLTAYWRKRFTITAPGLRKQGYKPLRRLREEIGAWNKRGDNAEEHGERIQSLQDFRELAKNCEGSRDVGAQLFTALLRGLGLETRMVANLQPAGFGWSKSEEAEAKKAKAAGKEKEVASDFEPENVDPRRKSTNNTAAELKGKKPVRKSMRGDKGQPINLEDSDSPLSSPPSENEQETDDDDDISIVDVTPSASKKPSKKYDRDLAFPNYWSEVFSSVSGRYIPVDPIVLSTIASNAELLQSFEPRGKKADKSKQVICYTIAHRPDGTAKDVTVRYLKKHQLPGKTKGMRMPLEKIPVYNRKGKVKKYEEYDWFRTVMSGYDRPAHKLTTADEVEDGSDLKPFKPATEKPKAEVESLQWYKQSAEFVLEDHLRREEAILPHAEPVKTFKGGKGDKAKEHPVYLRSDVVVCKTVESWHKEGRAIKVGEQPMKYVPMRAVTLIRKREIEDAQRETGEKLKQGLYSIDQTDWIIPPPIENGIIPKNAFGNMDVYVPTMVPKGAVHVPLRGTAKLCRRLEIDYAEACTGFEFGKQRAVPVLTGVVVADEHEMLVRDAWEAEQKEVKRKEDVKRTAAALQIWRKFVMGLRIVERMKTEYADTGESINPFVNRAKRQGKAEVPKRAIQVDQEEELAGGFFPEGHDEEEVPQHASRRGNEPSGVGDGADDGGGFLREELAHDADGHEGGGFLLEEVDDDADVTDAAPKNYAPITPVSLQSMHKMTDGANDSAQSDQESGDEAEPTIASVPPAVRTGTSKQNGRRRRVVSSSKKAASTRSKGKAAKPDEREDDAASSASELSDLESEGSDLAANGAMADSENDNTSPNDTIISQGRIKSSSPRVVVTPPKSSSKQRRSSKRHVKKETPLKSQYFPSEALVSDEEDE